MATETLTQLTTLEEKSDYPLTMLSYGGGQDSFAILVKLVTDLEFRNKFAPNKLVVVMSNTGDEHPETYDHVDRVAFELCKKHNIPFVLINNDMGFHHKTWQSLTAHWKLNNNVQMLRGRKSCTVSLKIDPIYKYLNNYIDKEFGFGIGKDHGKPAIKTLAKEFGKINVLIGFARGEEKRMAKRPTKHIIDKKTGKKVLNKGYKVWMEESIVFQYPLIDVGMDRSDAQEFVSKLGFEIPMPSNCMRCPFLSRVELLWLFNNYPKIYNEWVVYELNKINKFVREGKSGKNLGVFGEDLIPVVLEQAKEEYKDWSVERINEYKMSHGHCVATQY